MLIAPWNFPINLMVVKLAPALLAVGYILGYQKSAVMVSGSLISWLVLIPLIALVGDGLPTPLFPETRSLVRDLEDRVRALGIHTMFVGSDDELGQTSLAGVDLYPDVIGHLARLQNLRDHPLGFYQRLGYSVIRVMPDANGFGQHDIYLARRLVPPP